MVPTVFYQRMDTFGCRLYVYSLVNTCIIKYLYMNRYFEEDKAATAEICGQQPEFQVILAWASRKRHIFINGVLLCEKKHKTTAGYSVKGRHHISYQVEMPNQPMSAPDGKYTHGDGIIPAMPLDEIKIGDGGISRRSICVVCQKRYDKIFVPTSFCR